ncbi:uncharacterized protein BYT42DRAFT_573752 [Radiomyces spectabilis]|uniref:uncharacterized protein n=1 Tax=Radiomyces spectabilis TaxID=64574 RepID=UPI0022204B91|nr:uncharacterized protein BYT42DRAFT_573752 [Radiomyces spectabilis]KAI8376203.1 hypothetical protein BYT42DRAFT_573752 [Radiomyces spectabilis]
MPLSSSFADIAQKSMVLFLAGTTVYYMVNVGVLVDRRMKLKKEGRLEEELARWNGIPPPAKRESPNSLHAETDTTPTPMPTNDRPGC